MVKIHDGQSFMQGADFATIINSVTAKKVAAWSLSLIRFPDWGQVSTLEYHLSSDYDPIGMRATSILADFNPSLFTLLLKTDT